MTATIDKAGRVVIPRQLRDRAGLKPGTTLSMEYRDGKIEIEPARQQVEIVRSGSLLVLRAPSKAARLTTEQVNEILEEIRDERLEAVKPRHR